MITKADSTLDKLYRIAKKDSFEKKCKLRSLFKKHSIGDQITEIINHSLRVLQYKDKIDELFLESKKTVISDLLTLDTLLQQFEKSSIRKQIKYKKMEKNNDNTDKREHVKTT